MWDFEQPLRERTVGVCELVDEVSVLCGALSCLGQLVSIARESEGLLRDLRLRMGLFYGMACDLVRALRQREAVTLVTTPKAAMPRLIGSTGLLKQRYCDEYPRLLRVLPG